jgi:hypothetical protein
MRYHDINRLFFWIVGTIVAAAIIATTAVIVTKIIKQHKFNGLRPERKRHHENDQHQNSERGKHRRKGRTQQRQLRSLHHP